MSQHVKDLPAGAVTQEKTSATQPLQILSQKQSENYQ